MPGVPIFSVIIVAYRARRELLECLESVTAQPFPHRFEVIVVNNGPDYGLEAVISKNFPQVVFIQSPENKGYGAGNNLGAARARGQFLFFLNPDTVAKPGVLEEVVSFLQKNPRAGVAAPTLLDMSGKRFELQGTAELTPITAIGAHSLFHRLFPNNPVANRFWLRGQDLTKNRQVAAVPGTAFAIRADLFWEIGGFDEGFFLYFEEPDLCRRVRQAGKEVWILAGPKVKHHWGASTDTHNSRLIRAVFRQSRDLYFRKYYGKVVAFFMRLV